MLIAENFQGLIEQLHTWVNSNLGGYESRYIIFEGTTFRVANHKSNRIYGAVISFVVCEEELFCDDEKETWLSPEERTTADIEWNVNYLLKK